MTTHSPKTLELVLPFQEVVDNILMNRPTFQATEREWLILNPLIEAVLKFNVTYKKETFNKFDFDFNNSMQQLFLNNATGLIIPEWGTYEELIENEEVDLIVVVIEFNGVHYCF